MERSGAATAEFIMSFGSAHRAMKAEEALKEASVRFRLLPVPKALDASCGLVISVNVEELERAKKALKKGGVDPRNIYRKEGEEYVKV